MKKLFLENYKKLIVVILGIILSSSLTAFATYNYIAQEVGYTKKDGSNIDVNDALNELYAKMSSKMTYVGSVQCGKDQDSNNVAITFDKSLEAGEYIVIGSRSAVNNSKFGSTQNQTSDYFQLTGCDESKILNYEHFGEYTSSSSNYVNQFVNVYYCKLNNNGTISGKYNESKDDSNIIVQFFKYNN